MSMNFPGKFRKNSGTCPGNFLDISGKFPRNFLDFAWKFPRNIQDNSWTFPGNFLDISLDISGQIPVISTIFCWICPGFFSYTHMYTFVCVYIHINTHMFHRCVYIHINTHMFHRCYFVFFRFFRVDLWYVFSSRTSNNLRKYKYSEIFIFSLLIRGAINAVLGMFWEVLGEVLGGVGGCFGRFGGGFWT